MYRPWRASRGALLPAAYALILVLVLVLVVGVPAAAAAPKLSAEVKDGQRSFEASVSWKFDAVRYRVRLNGKDITDRFGSTGTGAPGVLLGARDRLRFGENELRASVLRPSGRKVVRRVHFRGPQSRRAVGVATGNAEVQDPEVGIGDRSVQGPQAAGPLACAGDQPTGGARQHPAVRRRARCGDGRGGGAPVADHDGCPTGGG